MGCTSIQTTGTKSELKRPPVMPFGGTRNDTTTHFAGKHFSVATLRERFGRRLREIRASRKMTQEEFAEALGMSVDFLSLIERGRNAPSFGTLDRMAKKLKLTVADLFIFNDGAR
jgi:DNA-binding XRE family transcriptional regulator